MSAYVDDARNSFGRMKMCHLFADSTAELLAMVDRIGVQRKWLQHAGEDKEHFDICLAKRRLAVKAGALEVTGRDLVAIVRARREPPKEEETGR